MGPELELKGKSQTTMTVPASKENECVPQELQDEHVRCESNFEDRALDVGELLVGKARNSDGEHIDIDVIECTNPSDHELVEAECRDGTEYSSSFGDTVSSTENGLMMNDAEVESPFFAGDALTSDFDEFGGAFRTRKKKLTDHWREFIRPLMWRCKWIELQIKEFESQALKYDRKVAECDKKRQFQFENFTSEGFNAKSLSFSHQIQNNEVMERKKRKRVEETTDTAAYVSCHSIFSYHEKRKSLAEFPYIDEYCGKLDIRTNNGNDEFGFNNGRSALEFRDGDSSLVQILCKIDELQSQARSLKNRVDKVVSENPGKFYSINRLSLITPSEAFTSSDQNPASPNAGDGMPVRSLYTSSQHVSNDTGDLFIPESAISSHGEDTPIPGRTESPDLPGAGSLHETNEGGFLIHKEATREELHKFERVLSQVTERPQVATEKLKVVPTVMPKAELLSDAVTEPSTESPPSSRSNANNKKMRGRRRSATGAWKRKLGSR